MYDYDDPMTLGFKLDYAKKQGFGGAFIRWIEYDDFNGNCRLNNKTAFPLTRTLSWYFWATVKRVSKQYQNVFADTLLYDDCFYYAFSYLMSDGWGVFDKNYALKVDHTYKNISFQVFQFKSINCKLQYDCFYLKCWTTNMELFYECIFSPF